MPKYKEERITLQNKSNYVEEFKNVIIVEKGKKTEVLDESSDDEIIEISETLKEQIQDDIKEQENTIKQISIDEEALNTDSEEITIEEDKIEDDVTLEEDKVTEDAPNTEDAANTEDVSNTEENSDDEMKGGSDIKKIVVHSFF